MAAPIGSHVATTITTTITTTAIDDKKKKIATTDQIEKICKQIPLAFESSTSSFEISKEWNFSSSDETKEFLEIGLHIIQQPPIEIRTSTLKEIRPFKCIVQVSKWSPLNSSSNCVSLRLCFADTIATNNVTYLDRNILLGDFQSLKVNSQGQICFDNLAITEASTKHHNREFAIEFSLGSSVVYSNPFFAYSHKKVLERRRNVHLRAMSSNSGSAYGNERMHVIGLPFIKSEQFRVRFRVVDDFSYGSSSNEELFGYTLNAYGSKIDHFSDSVVFFDCPPCPIEVAPGEHVNSVVEVTNDGRYYSNPIDFVYEGSIEKKKKMSLRSRI